MASVDTGNNPNDPNNPNTQSAATNQPAAQSTNQPATSGGAGAVTATGAGNVTGQVVGTNNPSQPFQNIASYLSANAPQSQALAGQVASSVSNPIAQTQSDITSASNDFSKSVNAGYTPENDQLTSSVVANPSAVVSDPNNVAAFQKQLNDSYTGPTDFTTTPNYTNLETEISNAQGLGQEAQTPTGIQSLLQGIEGPQMTGGINNLDTLLLAQDPTNFKTISDAGAAADTTNNTLGNLLTSQTTSNNASAQTAAQAAAAAAAAANAGLNTSATNVAAPINAQYNSDLTGTEQYNTALSSIQNAVLSSNLQNLTADQQKAVGLDPDIFAALKEYPTIFPSVSKANMPNLPLYYSGPNSASLPSDVSQAETSDQAAAVAALQQLANGTPLTQLAGLSGVAPTNPYSVPTDFGSYNNAGLSDYLFGNLNNATTEYANSKGADPAQVAKDTAFMNLLLKIAGNNGVPTTPPPTDTPPTQSPPLAPPTTPIAGGGGRAAA